MGFFQDRKRRKKVAEQREAERYRRHLANGGVILPAGRAIKLLWGDDALREMRERAKQRQRAARRYCKGYPEERPYGH